MGDRDERNDHGHELVAGNTYMVTFGDYGVGGSFTGIFLGWVPNVDMNQPPGDVPSDYDADHSWDWAKFDTGYVCGDRWSAYSLALLLG